METRYGIRCDWCQFIIRPGEGAKKDKLDLHTKPILLQTKPCLELYENYCKFIKEKCE